MRDSIPQEFKDVADILQGWEVGKKAIGFDEVLTWVRARGMVIAFRGDASKIENLAFKPFMVNNKNHVLDLSLQKIFGFEDVWPIRRLNERWTIHVVGVKDGAEEELTSPEAALGEVLDAVEVTAFNYVKRCGINISKVWVTIMPSEGCPWEEGTAVTRHYNARNKTVGSCQAPDWTTEITPRDDYGEWAEGVVGADLCRVVPIMKADPGGPVMVRDPSKNIDFMVTHAFGFSRPGIGWREISEFINRCGGLLFPSLAVSQLPAATIGEVFFVIDPLVVLQGLRPYHSGQDRWPAILYTTDAWTETTGTFITDAAVITYEQLTGQWNPGASKTKHFYILGPIVGYSKGDKDGGSRIEDTETLSEVMKHRSDVWDRNLSKREVMRLANSNTVDMYPYLEAKVNGIVCVDAIVACVVPTFMMGEVGKMLDAIGFNGELLPIELTPDEERAVSGKTSLDVALGILYKYSWRVYDVVSRFARSTGRIETLGFYSPFIQEQLRF